MATRKVNIICRRCGQPIPWGSTASTIGDDETTVYHPECAEEIIKEIHIDHLNHMLGMDSDTPVIATSFQLNATTKSCAQ